MSITIGVDPGKTGAVALLDSYGALVAIHDMPLAGGDVSPHLLANLEDWRNNSNPGGDFDNPGVGAFDVAVIEDVHSMPKQGVASSFGFGRSKGVAEGVFAGAGLRLVYVAPSTWKRALGLTKDKDACRRRAIELWPAHCKLFARVKDDGRAEAALIAWWHHRYGAVTK